MERVVAWRVKLVYEKSSNGLACEDRSKSKFLDEGYPSRALDETLPRVKILLRTVIAWMPMSCIII
jgi:hypothetical protein